MKKNELLELASLGIRTKVRSIERQLGTYWAQFPDIFLGDAPPQLLRPEPRETGNGHWPALTITRDDEDEGKAPAKKTRGKGRKKAKFKGVPIDVGAYKQLYDYLDAHPGALLRDVATAVSAHPANVRGKLLLGIRRGFFAKKGDGFHAKDAPQAE